MEDNIHDDKLDDYVRASFEDYEENPSDDMWDRVEEGLLPVAPASALRVHLLKYRWQLAAATVIGMLLSTLVCEHIAYENKLRALTEQAPNLPGTQPQGAAATGLSTGAEFGSGQTSLKAESQAKPAPGESGSKSPSEPLAREQQIASTSLYSPRALYPHTSQAHSGQDRPIGANQPLPTKPETLENGSLVALPGAILPPHTAQEPESIAEPRSMLAMEHILLEPPLLSSPTVRVAPVLHYVASPTKRFQEPSGWYLGAQTTLFASREKTRSQVARPGRPMFQNKRQRTELTSISWLGVGKKVNAQLSFETGLGYQRSVQTATHSPRFRFGDGANWGMGKRSFDYEVSTYSGTAEVSLRMDQTNPGNPPTVDDPVTLKITTREETALLRIPLLGRYQWGAGRLQGHVKAGILGNVLLNNSLELSARISENAQFRPVDGQDGYTLRLSKPGSVSLGYWLSSGASFRLTKHISLVAEPAICGDFARKDQNGRRLPEHVLFGLNVGANYYF